MYNFSLELLFILFICQFINVSLASLFEFIVLTIVWFLQEHRTFWEKPLDGLICFWLAYSQFEMVILVI